MKHTSNLMYNIGRIFTIVEIILGAILLPLGILLAILQVALEDFTYAGGVTLIGYGIWLLVSGILCLIFVSKAKKELADESKQNKTPFIITIVFGAISGNVFYVLAGIFGLIAEGQQGQKKNQNKSKNQKKNQKNSFGTY